VTGALRDIGADGPDAESRACPPEEVRRRALERLHREPPPGHDDPHAPSEHGDHALNRDQPLDLFHKGPHRPAAVLVPILAHPKGATVVLTRRTDHLTSHAGQVAFPGGKIEPDEAPMAAAIREAEEEIGLTARLIEPLGYLDLYQTGSGFRIVPVVALIDPAAEFRPDPKEVAAIFEVPLDFLMQPGNHQQHSRIRGGYRRRFYAMPYGGHYIWGVTAGIIRNLYDRVYR
jgi:8-oxo-dGTP pyrophosphatase MutT (NUDIX family)